CLRIRRCSYSFDPSRDPTANNTWPWRAGLVLIGIPPWLVPVECQRFVLLEVMSDHAQHQFNPLHNHPTGRAGPALSGKSEPWCQGQLSESRPLASHVRFGSHHARLSPVGEPSHPLPIGDGHGKPPHVTALTALEQRTAGRPEGTAQAQGHVGD